MKPTLEEYVKNLKAELKKEIAKREESEYRHAVTAEALDFYANCSRGELIFDGGNLARKVLNGVVEDET